MNEKHALYAVTKRPDGTHGPTFRVGQPTDWHTAQNRWAKVDQRRRIGRNQHVRFDGRRFTVAFFEVRAVDRDGRGIGSERHALAFPVPYRALRVAPRPDALDKAVQHYRRHYGPMTRREMRLAASPRRNWHTLAEIRSLDAAGIAPEPRPVRLNAAA